MSVAYDSTFEKGAYQTSPFSFVSNAGTVTGTVGSNSDRVLIAYLSLRGITSSGVSVTWGGTAMSAITSLDTSNFDSYLFGLIAPATGNQTLACAWTGGLATVTLGAVSLYNADQTTAWQNARTDTATGTSASSTVTSANGNLVVVGHWNNDASSTTLSTGTLNYNEFLFSGNYSCGRNPSTGASAVVAWTLGSSVEWGNVGCDVIAVGAGGGGTVMPVFMASHRQHRM